MRLRFNQGEHQSIMREMSFNSWAASHEHQITATRSTTHCCVNKGQKNEYSTGLVMAGIAVAVLAFVLKEKGVY